MRRQDLGDPLARWLATATVCIVAAFVATSGSAALRLRRVDEDARQLAAEIAPATECVAVTRGVLHELDDATVLAARGAATAADVAQMAARYREALARCPAAAALPSAARDFAASRDRVAAIEAADRALEHEVERQAKRARDVGATLAADRRRTAHIAIGLHSLAGSVALFAIVMVWVALLASTRASFAVARRSTSANGVPRPSVRRSSSCSRRAPPTT